MAAENEIAEIANNVSDISILSVTSLNEATFNLEVEYEAANDKRAEIYNYIKSKEWTLLEMHREHVSLEEVFRNLTIEGGEK